jgi:hypothetical protein
MRSMRASLVFALTMTLPACGVVRKPAPQAIPKVPARTATGEEQPIEAADLVGRWVFAPGDSTVPDPEPTIGKSGANPEEAKEADATENPAVTSPAGSVLILAEGGVMLAREASFVRRGTWKFEEGTLRIVVEPPPRRIEMGLVPEIAGDLLTLEGADELVLVYHRDHFIPPRPAP